MDVSQLPKQQPAAVSDRPESSRQMATPPSQQPSDRGHRGPPPRTVSTLSRNSDQEFIDQSAIAFLRRFESCITLPPLASTPGFMMDEAFKRGAPSQPLPGSATALAALSQPVADEDSSSVVKILENPSKRKVSMDQATAASLESGTATPMQPTVGPMLSVVVASPPQAKKARRMLETATAALSKATQGPKLLAPPLQPPPVIQHYSASTPIASSFATSHPFHRSTAPLASGTSVPHISPVPARILLLARERDQLILSPLHVFVRNQIEVFTATKKELAQPAPGRKQPIRLGQLGLRCIHCRHVLDGRKRVKRAVCYPSSIGRIYHSVSDMKFDHFTQCKEIPPNVNATFDRLKAEDKRSGGKKSTANSGSSKCKSSSYSSSTAQYYHDAAMEMGMLDGSGGIFLACAAAPSPGSVSNAVAVVAAAMTRNPLMQQVFHHHYPGLFPALGASSVSQSTAGSSPRPTPGETITTDYNTGTGNPYTAGGENSIQHQAKPSSPRASSGASAAPVQASQSNITPLTLPCDSRGQVTLSLAAPEDPDFLGPEHCFVRRHIEIFAADAKDVAAPAPGRKSRVVFGQVGLRCIHCVNIPAKEKVKRAVCYPPSISAIYHSVSNMKFDHFGSCKALPAVAREEFIALRRSCSRRGTAGNNSQRNKSLSSNCSNASSSSSMGSASNSTAQYYQDSAINKGLVDSDMGIRFREYRAEEADIAIQGVPFCSNSDTGVSSSSGKPGSSSSNTNSASSCTFIASVGKKETAGGEDPHAASVVKTPAQQPIKLYTGMSALMMAASQAV